jgi:hypothetical protein
MVKGAGFKIMTLGNNGNSLKIRRGRPDGTLGY